MDMLRSELTDVNSNVPRDVVFGPKQVRSPGYGISLALPRGWVAAIQLGEIYGIEPVSRSDGRIYVMGQVADIADVIRKNSNELELGFVTLFPVSTPFVDKNQVSIHASVQGTSPHKYAYVTTTVTPENKAITLAALFDEPAALLFKAAVGDLSDSIKDLPV